ncbi:MAG: hypothetical protein U0U69_08440 [Acidimicrobiia bacterium]
MNASQATTTGAPGAAAVESAVRLVEVTPPTEAACAPPNPTQHPERMQAAPIAPIAVSGCGRRMGLNGSWCR